MPGMGTSGLMSGDGKRGGVSASAPALVLDSTIVLYAPDALVSYFESIIDGRLGIKIINI